MLDGELQGLQVNLVARGRHQRARAVSSSRVDLGVTWRSDVTVSTSMLHIVTNVAYAVF